MFATPFRIALFIKRICSSCSQEEDGCSGRVGSADAEARVVERADAEHHRAVGIELRRRQRLGGAARDDGAGREVVRRSAVRGRQGLAGRQHDLTVLVEQALRRGGGGGEAQHQQGAEADGGVGHVQFGVRFEFRLVTEG